MRKNWNLSASRFRGLAGLLLACVMAVGCVPMAIDGPGLAGGPLFKDITGQTQDPWHTPSGSVATVWVFTTFDCPVANGYAPSINKIASDFAKQKVRFFFVHVDPEELTVAKAQKHAREYSYTTAPILIDEHHDLVKRAGAKTTPEVAVFTPGGAMVYRGRIDNWYAGFGKKRPRPTVHDLRDVLTKLVNGEAVVPRVTEPVGCMIFELEPKPSSPQ
jgi:hypothetical protein